MGHEILLIMEFDVLIKKTKQKKKTLAIIQPNTFTFEIRKLRYMEVTSLQHHPDRQCQNQDQTLGKNKTKQQTGGPSTLNPVTFPMIFS